MELGTGDAERDMDEMIGRCCDILASNIPQELLRQAISALVMANDVRSKHSPASEYSEIMLDCLREANRCLGSHDPFVSETLAVCLSHRFEEIHSINDYKEVMALFDRIITSEPNRDCPGPYAARALFDSAILAMHRAHIYKNPEGSEEAIHRYCNFLRIPSPNDFKHRKITWLLAQFISKRSSHFGIAVEGLPEGGFPDPEVTSFRHLIASLRARSTADKTNWWAVQEERSKHYQALDTACHTTDLAEIAEAIKYCQLLLAVTPPSSSATYFPAETLGRVLFRAFKFTDDTEYLNKSIATFCNILRIPGAKWGLFKSVVFLHDALSDCYRIFRHKKDFDEVMQLYPMACNDTYATVPD